MIKIYDITRDVFREATQQDVNQLRQWVQELSQKRKGLELENGRLRRENFSLRDKLMTKNGR